MCTVGQDTLEEAALKFMPKPNQLAVSDKCNKCRVEKPCVVLRYKDCYCKTCFLASTVHKFKALLGKHRLIRPNEFVLVLHKAGHASTALLQFLRTGLDLTTPKKLRFNPIILYIDDQFYLNSNERIELASKIEEQVNKFNFDIRFITFKDYVDQKNIAKILYSNVKNLCITDEDPLREMFLKKCSTTNRNNIIANIRRQLLIDVAKFLNCKFIFTPEIALDAAASILTNVSLGKGEHISLDTGFCDSRDSDAIILRPLKHFDIKELSMYNYYNNIEPVSVREYKVDPYTSVQGLLEKFIKDLQVNYPATVTTIVKTGDKLVLDNTVLRDVCCNFCKAPLQNKSTEMTSEESTEFSHWISTQCPGRTLSSQDNYNNLINFFEGVSDNNYCYTCKKLTPFVKIQ